MPPPGALTINQLATRCECDVQTVRFYERDGLLPQANRSVMGVRFYGDADIQRLNFLRHLRSMGLSLPEIKRFLATEGTENAESEAQALLESQVVLVEKRLRAMAMLNKKLVALKAAQGAADLSRERIVAALSELAPFSGALA